MTLESKERLLSNLIEERFAEHRLDDDQRIVHRICHDAGIEWAPVEGEAETARAELIGGRNRIAATRRTMAGYGVSTLGLRLLDVTVGGSPQRRLSFVEKRLAKPIPLPRWMDWVDEGLFYLDIQPELQGSGFRVPGCVLLSARPDGTYSLCLERIAELQPARTLENRRVAATALGRLAAVAARRKIGARPWLRTRRVPAGFLVAESIAQRLERLDQLDILDPATRRSYETAHELLRRVHDVQSAFSPTIQHNDAHSGNVRVGSDHIACVLDWARVSTGVIGEDLCKLFQSWVYSDTEPWNMEDFAGREEALLQCYMGGVREILPTYDEEQIRFSYYVGSIVHSIHRLSGKHRAMEKFMARASENRGAARRVGLYYAYTASKIAACQAMI